MSVALSSRDLLDLYTFFKVRDLPLDTVFKAGDFKGRKFFTTSGSVSVVGPQFNVSNFESFVGRHFYSIYVAGKVFDFLQDQGACFYLSSASQAYQYQFLDTIGDWVFDDGTFGSGYAVDVQELLKEYESRCVSEERNVSPADGFFEQELSLEEAIVSHLNSLSVLDEVSSDDLDLVILYCSRVMKGRVPGLEKLLAAKPDKAFEYLVNVPDAWKSYFLMHYFVSDLNFKALESVVFVRGERKVVMDYVKQGTHSTLGVELESSKVSYRKPIIDHLNSEFDSYGLGWLDRRRLVKSVFKTASFNDGGLAYDKTVLGGAFGLSQTPVTTGDVGSRLREAVDFYADVLLDSLDYVVLCPELFDRSSDGFSKLEGLFVSLHEILDSAGVLFVDGVSESDLSPVHFQKISSVLDEVDVLVSSCKVEEVSVSSVESTVLVSSVLDLFKAYDFTDPSAVSEFMGLASTISKVNLQPDSPAKAEALKVKEAELRSFLSKVSVSGSHGSEILNVLQVLGEASSNDLLKVNALRRSLPSGGLSI